MITIIIHRKGDCCRGFSVRGHAGYADKGEDIVCSAVSALTINAVNSIEAFTKDRFSVRSDDGLLKMELDGEISEDTRLLLDSMILGLKSIQTQYGNEFIRLKFKEV